MNYENCQFQCSNQDCGYHERGIKPKKFIFGITSKCPICGSDMHSSELPDEWPVETLEERKRWQKLAMARPLRDKR